MPIDTCSAALRRQVAQRQLETGYEFNPMPGSRGVASDPGEPARRSRMELEVIVAGRPTDSLCGETKIPAAPRESRETKIAAAQGETKNTLPRETENREAVSAAGGIETKIRKRGRPRKGTVRPWVAAGVSRASWYRRRKATANTEERAAVTAR